MKSFIIIISLFMLSAQAGEGVGDSSGGGKLTWEKILSDYNRYVPDANKIRFENRSFDPFDVCYVPATDEIRTASEVKTYDRYSRGDRDLWSQNGKKYLYTDRVQTREICGGHGDRCHWEQIIEEYSLNPKIKVRAPARGDRSFGKLLFEKEFKIKNCF